MRRFAPRLPTCARLPPEQYSDEQWEVLGAILRLLPRAVGQLKLVFQARGQVDFTEVSQGALRALGGEEAPTDLALALDYRIRHLLIDEFQDTSISQYELVARLTAGWERGDGRTRVRGRRPDAVDLPLSRSRGRTVSARARRGHCGRRARADRPVGQFPLAGRHRRLGERDFRAGDAASGRTSPPARCRTRRRLRRARRCAGAAVSVHPFFNDDRAPRRRGWSRS